MIDMTQRRRVVYSQTMWMLIATIILSVLDVLSLRTFIVMSFIGLITIVEATAPIYIQLPWRSRLRIVTLVALCAFGFFVLLTVLRFVEWNPFF
ncbi:hypothetical protein [Haladaptatus sp. CMAA 1911]|uniref:hypothetical protein n=1 Tax=unclassified Haladaptatus TaxID=2622732 RepID=UPI0037545918